MTWWLVVGLDTGVAWPTKETTTVYRGWGITLRPETDALAPAIAVPFETPQTREQAMGLAMEFLSALAWVEGRRLQPTSSITGPAILSVGKGSLARMTNPSFQIEYLPEPSDDKARLALALYREALNVNSKPYQFLGFYKIINMLHGGGLAQKAWINATLGSLDGFDAKERLAALRTSEPDIGEYLYASGRCAVAHAFQDPVVNPDDPDDVRRLAADLPLMKALAEFAIEHEFGVKSRRTIWREHLFELEGFRSHFGEEVASQLKQKVDVPIGDLRPLARLSIRLSPHGQYSAFENLHSQIIESRDGRVLVSCNSPDHLMQTGLSLNFADERLEFDPVADCQVYDDGSSKAMRYEADLRGLTKDLLGNGALEVWDADCNTQLGRCRPFLPKFNTTRVVAQMESAIARFEEEATRREAAE